MDAEISLTHPINELYHTSECGGMAASTEKGILIWFEGSTYVIEQRLVCPQNRKPNSESKSLQQSRGLFAGCQARRKESSCSEELNSLLARAFKDNVSGTSLVVQWLRVRLPTQGTQVWCLVQEDPTCHGASKSVRHNYWACSLEPASHNYWAHSPRAHALQQEKPPQREACALQWRVAPARCN